MIKILNRKSHKIIINIDNKNLELYHIENSIFLNKKNISILFDTKKSDIKSLLNKSDTIFFDKKKGKNIKLYNLETIIVLWYKLKKTSETKAIINLKRYLSINKDTNLVIYTKNIINKIKEFRLV